MSQAASIHGLFPRMDPAGRARISLQLLLGSADAPPPEETQRMIETMDRLRPQGLFIQPRTAMRSWSGLRIEALAADPVPARIRIACDADTTLCDILGGAVTAMTPGFATHEAVLRDWWLVARDDLVVIWNDALPGADDPRRIDPETLPWKAP